MTFGDADVESALGHLPHHNVHRTAGGHGGRHADNLRILSGQFQKGMAEHVLIFLGFVRVVVHEAFTRVGIELAWGVPDGHVLLRWGIAVTFLGVQVQQFRPLHVLDLFEDAHQFLHVMSVEGTEVTDVHTLEDVLLVRDGTLQSVRQTDETLAPFVAEHALAVHPARGLETQGVVGFIGAQIQQILFHTTHRAVYRHVVVVEDDQQVVGTRRRVVQTFEGQSAAHGSVADNGHHMTILLLFEFGRNGHTQGRRYRVARMTAGKSVVFAFGR